MHESPGAAIFDVEGTLIDCVPLVLESWRRTLLAAGHCFTLHDLQPYSGMDGEWMLERLLPQESDEFRQRLLKAHGECYRADFIEHAQPFMGVRHLLEQLKSCAIPIGIATTCKADELGIYDLRMRVVDLADAICCGETVRHGKPNPSLLQHCLKTLAISNPQQCIAVGDTPYDALAAKASGAKSAGLLTGGFSERSLRDAGHDWIFGDVRELCSIWDGDVCPINPRTAVRSAK